MPSPAAARARKGLDYAENELGVHEIHSSALAAREQLRVAHEIIVEQRAVKRRLEGEISEREVEIINDEYSSGLGLSIAAIERNLKVVLPKDARIKDLRKELAACINLIERTEVSLKLAEADTRIAVGRMTQLGGYFNYLAAIKNQRSMRSGDTE